MSNWRIIYFACRLHTGLAGAVTVLMAALQRLQTGPAGAVKALMAAPHYSMAAHQNKINDPVYGTRD